jgi:hypothetical protein
VMDWTGPNPQLSIWRLKVAPPGALSWLRASGRSLARYTSKILLIPSSIDDATKLYRNSNRSGRIEAHSDADVSSIHPIIQVITVTVYLI